MSDTTQSSSYAGAGHMVGEEFSNRIERNTEGLTRRVDPAHLTAKDVVREDSACPAVGMADQAIQSAGIGTDDPHFANIDSSGQLSSADSKPSANKSCKDGSSPSVTESQDDFGAVNDERLAERERILRLHAADLVAELQNWAEEIDTRESQLNTRDALLDQRERQFRTWEKFKKQEIDDTIRLTERLQQEAKDRLKRVAALELGAAGNL